MACPTTTNTTEATECFNQIAVEAINFAEFALILTTILLIAVAFLLYLLSLWLTL